MRKAKRCPLQAPWRRLVMRSLLLASLLAGACTTWQQPSGSDDTDLRERAVTAKLRDVRLSAAVLSSEESRRLLGADVNRSGVQAVWLEVQNRTKNTLWLMRTGTDPDYFSPLEVSWSYHSVLRGTANDSIDAHFEAVSFQNPIAPGETKSGIIFATPHHQTRLLNVDLLGPGRIFPFSLFPIVPDNAPARSTESIIKQLQKGTHEEIQNERGLRSAIEKMPCCTTVEGSKQSGAPINIVLVGDFADIAAAMVRRDYRRMATQSDQKQRLFGRPPDVVTRKAGNQGDRSANWMRLWLAPLRYRGKPVFLAQAGRPRGGRFAGNPDANLQMHHNVDEVRNHLIQEMLYSGGLAKLGFVKGAGWSAQPPRANKGQISTDGFRAVLFFVTRPLSLSDVEILEWEPLLQDIGVSARSREVHEQL